MNVEADAIEQADGRRIMVRCHGLLSFGMLAAAAIGVGARAIPVSPGLHLWALAPVVIVAGAALASGLTRAGTGPRPAASRGIALPSRRTFVVVGFALSAGIAQMAAQNRSVICLRDSFAAPDWTDTLPLPAFLVSMALGRFMADGWITRFGARRVALALGGLAVIAGLTVATGSHPWAVILGFGFLGLGGAVHSPLLIVPLALSLLLTRATVR